MSTQQIPIDTLSLFPELDHLLLELLESLTSEDWQKPTTSKQWKVKDVAAHLLDGNLRSVSMLRDQHYDEVPGPNLIAYLNRLNGEWVKAMRRVSPEIILNLLRDSAQEYHQVLKSLPPFDRATFAVAWAGEQVSQNWFHIAREFTEKWHHQQQIRWAVKQEAPLYNPRLYSPYLQTSMRAVPHHYSTYPTRDPQTLSICIEGNAGSTWLLESSTSSWTLKEAPKVVAKNHLVIPEEIAWRIFTNGIDRTEAMKYAQISGHQELSRHFFDVIAVMA